jgi:hypothetical protein
MRTKMCLAVVLICVLACKGGGANVNVGQDSHDDRGDGTFPVATPFFTDDGDCARQCVRLSDGTWQVTVDCPGDPERTFIVGVLPPNCTIISELPPITNTASGGVTGQVTEGGQ